MRKTGSREPRASLEASAVSPFSIAVKTFSMRFGSRRNQRPPHQKIRSITTVSPMIDTIKIGHMIGPPLRNLSINQLLPSRPGSAAGEAAGGALGAAVAAGLSVPAGAGLVTAPGAAGCPTAPGCPGAAGCCAAGCPGAAGCCAAAGCPGAAGCCAAGCPGAAACPGGTLVAGGCCAAAAGLVPAAGGAFAGGGDCASEIRASASEHRQVASSVFIVEAGVESDRCSFETGFLLSQTSWSRVEQNFSFFSATLASRPHL